MRLKRLHSLPGVAIYPSLLMKSCLRPRLKVLIEDPIFQNMPITMGSRTEVSCIARPFCPPLVLDAVEVRRPLVKNGWCSSS